MNDPNLGALCKVKRIGEWRETEAKKRREGAVVKLMGEGRKKRRSLGKVCGAEGALCGRTDYLYLRESKTNVHFSPQVGLFH